MQQPVAPSVALQGALALCEGLRTNHTIVHLELGYGRSGSGRKWELVQVGMGPSGNEHKRE